ncbi:MAG: hypothetical protein NZ700_15625, partial [Gemmataceae bacterium]|nr:hypothetical protein [Gemmataceae bacterium]MDW8264025.1 hypothetical protein [Gemmataceae bacterium]
MRAGPWIGVLGSCLLAGCVGFGKKPPSAGGELARPTGGINLPRLPGAPPPPAVPPTPPEALAAASGILAGQVLDAYNRRPPPTYIQVSLVDDGEKAEPIEVAADKEGFFTIQGL